MKICKCHNPTWVWKVNFIFGCFIIQGDRLLSDPKKYFVWEVYFCQKKYIFDPERSTNRSKSDKIIYELPHFWPLIFAKYFINFTYNIRNYKVAGIIWHWFLTNFSQQNFNRQYFTFLVFFVCKILFFGLKIIKNDQIS